MTTEEVRREALRLAREVFKDTSRQWPTPEELTERIAEQLDGRGDVTPYQLREIAREAIGDAAGEIARGLKKSMKRSDRELARLERENAFAHRQMRLLRPYWGPGMTYGEAVAAFWAAHPPGQPFVVLEGSLRLRAGELIDKKTATLPLFELAVAVDEREASAAGREPSRQLREELELLRPFWTDGIPMHEAVKAFERTCPKDRRPVSPDPDASCD